jgi:hypothetical protein
MFVVFGWFRPWQATLLRRRCRRRQPAEVRQKREGKKQQQPLSA